MNDTWWSTCIQCDAHLGEDEDLLCGECRRSFTGGMYWHRGTWRPMTDVDIAGGVL